MSTSIVKDCIAEEGQKLAECRQDNPLGVLGPQPLEEKWALSKNDKDMIVMQHKFEFEIKKSKKRLISSMILIGTDDIRTAMAKTVGLPVFFAAKLILEAKTTLKGIKIPVYEELYSPILKSLEKEGISFVESIENI